MKVHKWFNGRPLCLFGFSVVQSIGKIPVAFSLCCFVIYVYIIFVLDKTAGFGCRHFI